MKEWMHITPMDNVIIALKDLEAGKEIVLDDGKVVTLASEIKQGHKIALGSIAKGSDIIRYGFPIGHATEDINQGEHIHSHNLKTNLDGIQEYRFAQKLNELNQTNQNLTFKGYKRANGTVGVRNELWIVPTVGCVNGMADRIIEIFREEVQPEGIDSISVFKHNYGCSQLGDDHENTRTILKGIATHPNAGGVMVFGLGCENNVLSEFKEVLGEYDEKRIKFLEAQKVEDEIEAGVALLKELYEEMKNDQREDLPLSELKIGLKCGGSDGFSGITANPLLGAFSDFLIGQGGTTVLTEVPEMFGAETILMERAESEEVFNSIVSLVNEFKEYFTFHNQPIYENPSPGNKEGGITTLEEKSLGCTQKGGLGTVVDVLAYGEKLKKNGLNLLNAPGNDLVSSTALGAAGCQIVLFTTGRGTPFGSFVPTLKVSTNSSLYNQKRHWMDFNAGQLLEDHSMEEVLQQFVDYLIQVASGEYVNNEKNGFHEMAIFKTGVTL